jgi:dTDP-4-dehydrorhamnose reductase
MRLLITGAAGMLGQDVRAAADAAGYEAIALTRAELDIADADAVDAVFEGSRPEAVINCAAWTDVDGAESEPAGAAAINGRGAGNVARAAAATDAWTIQISSDYVFSGTKGAPYVESDAAEPISSYGVSKLDGELEVARAAPESHTIVRSSWLFGAGGKCFPKTILRLAAEREQLDVVCDQVGTPTYTGHLAQAVVELAAGRRLGVLHVACTGRCSWFQFAREIVAAAGVACEVRPITTIQYPLPAARPPFSALESERGAPALPTWRAGLQEFMSETAGVTS